MNQSHMPELPYALEASNLSVILGGQKVLEIPSLQVLPNEVLIVIGPNGSGKTTLLLSLALLLRPASGTISFDGQSISNGSEILRLRRRFAVVFQESLLLNTTVWDNVTLGLRMRGFKNDETKARTQKWLERFDIAPLARRQAKTLSGGEAKRVSLARAFALQPEVLFLDEPFAALDSPTRQALIQDLGHVLRETGVTTVMVTHDRNEALALADRVAVLINGRLRQIGLPEEVFSSPADEQVAGFVGVENILPGAVVAQKDGIASVSIEGRQIEAVSRLLPGAKVTVCLRPEDVTLTVPEPKAAASTARNRLSGRLVTTSHLDSQVRVTLDCGFPLVALITQRSCAELGLAPGREVVASFKASSVHLIARSSVFQTTGAV